MNSFLALQNQAAMIQEMLCDALQTLRDSMAALEEVRNVKEIALSATCDPLMLVVDPSLSRKTEG